MATGNIVEYRLRLDASGVQAGAAEGAKALDSIGQAGAAAGAQASQGMTQVEQATKGVTTAQTQAKSAGEAFLAMLQDQVAVAGRTTEGLLQYRAAQAGVAAEAAPLIQQLQNQKAAQQAAADAARAEEAAQREAASAKQRAQASADAFLAGLRDQVATTGRTTEGLLRYQAAQAGVAAEAAPLIQQLQNQKAAQQAAADAARAEEAAQREAASAKQRAQASADAFLAGLRDQVATTGRTTEGLLRYQAAQAGVAAEAAPLILQLQNQKAAQQAAADAARTEEAAQREAASAKQRAQATADAFVAGLRDQAAVQGKSATEAMRYRAAQLGVSESAGQYINAIEAAAKANAGGAISAGQHAMAMRQLPMQITDVVTSLASGMPIWMIAVQQGGQIKDSFGGVGNALKAVTGLITPATAAFAALAAGAALLGVAYYQGSAEADAFRKSIVMTGGIAGVTVSGMTDMARAIGEVTGGQHAASAALVEMAGSGAIAGENLQKFTQTAVDLEKYAGQPIKTTAAHMAEMGNEPVKASIKLNEQYNYLTETVYKQIKALEDQGEKEQAAAVAQSAYSVAMAARAQEMKGSMGMLERGWDSLGNAANRAWNAMLNVGRAASLGEIRGQIEDTNREINDLLSGKESTYAQTSFGLGARSPAARITELQRKLGELNAKAGPLEAEDALAPLKAQEKANEKEKVLARQQIDELRKNIRTRAQIREDEISELKKNSEKIKLEKKDYDDLLAGIEAKYKDPKGPKGPKGPAGITVTDNELANMRGQLEAAQQYQLLLQKVGVGATQLNSAERESLKIAEQIKLTTNAKTLARLNEKKGVADSLAVITRSNDGLAKSLKGHQDLIEATGKDTEAITQRAKEQEAANSVFGKGRTAIEEMTLATLEHQLAEADSSDRFDPEYVKGLELKIAAQRRFVSSLKEADYNTVNQHTDELLRNARELASVYEDELALSGLTGLERERVVAVRQVELKYAKELAKIEQGTLSDAEKQAQREKVYQARRIENTATASKATESYYAKAADSINQSLTDALLRGFESGKSFAKNFADTVKNMFNTMVLRPVISAIMAPVSSAINGVVQGGLASMGQSGSGGTDLMGMASNASSIYSLASGNSTLSTVGGWLGIGGGTAAAATGGLGLSAGATGLGLSAGASGLGLTAGSAGASAIGAGIGTSAAVTGGAAGGAAAAGGAEISGALAAVPVWGWAALAVLAVLGSGAFSTRGANHSGGVYSTGGQGWNDSASLLMGNDRGDALGDFTQRGNSELGGNVQKAVTGLLGVYEKLADSVGSERKIDVVAGFAANGKHKDEDSYGYYKILDKVSGQVIADYRNRELGKDDAAWQKYIADLGSGIVLQLRGADIPKWIDDVLAELGESPSLENLAAAVQEINTAQEAFKQFGRAMPQFAAQSDAALSSLMASAGGRQALVGQLGSFYSNYYSESERTAVATSMLTEELGKLGYAMPASRDQFRGWVTAAIDSGAAGADSAAGLLKLESAVAQLLPAVETTTAGISQTLQGLLDQRGNLETELLRASGDSEGYARAQRAAAIKGYTEAETAAWDYNNALQAQVSALDAVAERNRAMTEQRASLEADLWLALGDDAGFAAAQRALATQGYSDAELAAWDYNNALQQQISSLDEAAELQASLASIMGTTSKTVQETLQDLLERLNATSAFRANLGNSMESARLQTMGLSDQAAYLRNKESGLWGQLGSAEDPLAIAEQIQQAFTDRINVEAKLRADVDNNTLTALQQQFSASQSLRSAAISMRDTADGLRLGGESLMNPYAQLQYATTQFRSSYALAKEDPRNTQAWRDVQTYGQSYAQLGRANWASSPSGVAIFNEVTDAMDQLAALGLSLDPEIEAQQKQIELLQKGNDKTDQGLWIAEQTLAQNIKLDDYFGRLEQTQKSDVEKQFNLATQQVSKAQQTVDAIKTQASQSEAYMRKKEASDKDMLNEMKRMRDALAQLERKLK